MKLKFSDKIILAYLGKDSMVRINSLLIKTKVFNKKLGLKEYERFVFRLPENEKTDGATIPRLVWAIINPTDWRILFASQPHDNLTEKKDKQISGIVYDKLAEKKVRDVVVFYTQKEADKILREKMESFGGGPVIRNVVYFSVRLFQILKSFFNKLKK